MPKDNINTPLGGFVGFIDGQAVCLTNAEVAELQRMQRADKQETEKGGTDGQG